MVDVSGCVRIMVYFVFAWKLFRVGSVVFSVALLSVSTCSTGRSCLGLGLLQSEVYNCCSLILCITSQVRPNTQAIGHYLPTLASHSVFYHFVIFLAFLLHSYFLCTPPFLYSGVVIYIA